MKICTKCKKEKYHEMFAKNRSTVDRLEYWCKDCRRKYYGLRPANDTSNLSGKRFGRLVAIRPTERRINKHVVWECDCDCGSLHYVVASVLKHGKTTSCGCWRRERLTKHNGKGTRLYSIWKGMRQRCNNENNPKYHRYGERGIDICVEWGDFKCFREWALSSGYNNNLTIDKIDNNVGYSPDNCQWISAIENTLKWHYIDRPLEAE